MVQKKASSDLNLYVLMFYNLSFAFNCNYIICYTLIVILHFI